MSAPKCVGPYMIYELATGLLMSRLIAHPDQVAVNTPADCGAIDGDFDPRSYRVDLSTGEIVDWQPERPSPDHEWDSGKRRWELTEEAAQRHERRARALQKIRQIETESQPRALREFTLGHEGAAERLAEMEREIAALRGDL